METRSEDSKPEIRIEINEKKRLKEPAKRKWLPLEKKLDIIRSHESGKTYAKIARENGMNESSVRSILRRKDQYKAQAVSTSSFLTKVVTRQGSSLLTTVERLLIAWIEDCNQKRIDITENVIQAKALSLFNDLKKSGEGDPKEKFAASRGWFYRFKNRVNLQNCVILGDKPPADKDGADRFVTEFQQIIQDGGYTHQQIFNVDETSVFWKKMPSKTFLAESEKSLQGHKPSRDSLTFLVGGNASGDKKLKPLVVFRAETPSALKDCEKSLLPVIWRSNKRAWLTQDIFTDWFTNYFSPTVEAYCRSLGIEFKILLLLDFSPSHDITFVGDNIKVVFLPPNTAPLIQPLSQGIFSTFKGCYIRQILSQAIQASTGAESFSLQEFWRNYNIKNAINNISASWGEISDGDLVSVWHKLLPDVESKDFGKQIEGIIQDIVTMGKYFGLDSLDVSDVQTCIDSSILNESNDVSMKIEEQIICKEEIPDPDEEDMEDCNTEDPNMEDPSTEDLEKILEGVDVACETILAGDSDVERSIKVRQALQNGIQCYRDMYLERQKSGGYY